MDFHALKTEYDKLTARNDHSTAALLLVRSLGTAEEVKTIEAISARQSLGGINKDDQTERDNIARKYFDQIKAYKTLNLEFRGIDDWNRPVYKVIDQKVYFGSVNKLFDWGTPEEEVNAFFKENTQWLEFFGDHFGCEPNGGRNDKLKLIIE